MDGLDYLVFKVKNDKVLEILPTYLQRYIFYTNEEDIIHTWISFPFVMPFDKDKVKKLLKTRLNDFLIPYEINESILTKALEENKINFYFNTKETIYYLEKDTSESQNARIRFLGESIDTLTIAKRFIEEYPLYFDKAKIWWEWNSKNKRWEIIDDVDVLNLISKGTDLLGITKSGKKAELLESLKMVARDSKPKEAPKDWIQFKDEIIDISSEKRIIPSKEYFLKNPIPYELGEEEQTPVMDKLFSEWVGENLKQTLYEIIAYSLLPYVPIHRGFIFVGSGLNGKSKFLELLTKFVGNENSCTTDLDLILQSRFELFKLYGKLLCVMGETNSNELNNSSRLKQITDGSVIGFEKKGKDPFDAPTYAKLCIATNSLPITNDKSNGFYRRWLIIDFPNQFTEKKDVLAEIPEIEYSNLAKKSIRILKELLVKREFTNEGSIEERKQRYEDRSNPLQKFLTEETETSFEGFIYKFEFREKFETWLAENKYRKMSEKEISSLMSKQFEEKQKGENKWRAYVGISWKSQHSQDSQVVPTQLSYMESDSEVGVNLVNPVTFERISEDYSGTCSYCGNSNQWLTWKDNEGNHLCGRCYRDELEEEVI